MVATKPDEPREMSKEAGKTKIKSPREEGMSTSDQKDFTIQFHEFHSGEASLCQLLAVKMAGCQEQRDIPHSALFGCRAMRSFSDPHQSSQATISNEKQTDLESGLANPLASKRGFWSAPPG